MNTLLFFTFCMCLLSRVALSQVQRCSMNLCPSIQANSTEDSQFYDLQLSSQDHLMSTSETGKVKVSVKMQGSVTLKTKGAKYFKIESFSKESAEPVGTFTTPSQNSEVELCTNNEMVFYSCEPRVTDLLRTYEWIAPTLEVGDVCFRLSILKDGENETCEYVTKCISTKPSADSGILESSLVELPVSSSHREACYRRRNCSTSRLRTMCGTDMKEYPSRCYVRLEACLIGDSSLKVKHAGECERPTTPPPGEKPTAPPQPVGPCFNETLLALSGNNQGWIPNCDCQGYFKPVQCSTVSNRCWCSTRLGALNGALVTFSETIDFSPCL